MIGRKKRIVLAKISCNQSVLLREYPVTIQFQNIFQNIQNKIRYSIETNYKLFLDEFRLSLIACCINIKVFHRTIMSFSYDVE